MDTKAMAGVVARFLDGADPNSRTVQAGLGLSSNETQVFWVALVARDPQTGVIINLNNVASKVVKGASYYITQTKKKGMINHGSGRGAWVITSSAIEKMMSILESLSAVPAGQGADSAADKKTAGKKKISRKAGTKKVIRRKVKAKKGKKLDRTMNEVLTQMRSDLADKQTDLVILQASVTRLETAISVLEEEYSE